MSENQDTQAYLTPQAHLGALLRQQRLAKNIDVPSMARSLILSIAQINSLESGTQDAFHNASFYLRALKKYLSHLGLSLDTEICSLFEQTEAILLNIKTISRQNEVNSLINAGLAHRRIFYFPALKKWHLVLTGLILLVLLGFVVYLLTAAPERPQNEQIKQSEPKSAERAALPNQSVAVPKPQNQNVAQITPGVQLKPQPQNVSTTDNLPAPTPSPLPESSPAKLKLTFSEASWVQVVEQNGKRTEKVFTPQDTIELDASTLTSLVVGNARHTQLFSGDREIDLAKYLNASSGVARFSRQEIMALTP